jgi:hypothetical protein
MNPSTLELITYTLKPGVSSDALLATNDSMAEFLKEQPGFIYRSLSPDAQGGWIDICYWQSEAEAKAASDALMADPRGVALIDLCDSESVVCKYLPCATEVLAESLATMA